MTKALCPGARLVVLGGGNGLHNERLVAVERSARSFIGRHTEHLLFARLGIIYVAGDEPAWLERRAHPPRARATVGPAIAECLELHGRHESGAHELDLIHHPQRVAVEQRIGHWPPPAGRGVAAIECVRQKHVLCADQDGGPLGLEVPRDVCFVAHAAHKNVHADVLADGLEEVTNNASRLLDEHPHRKAEHEASRPVLIAALESTIGPRADNAEGLAEPGGYSNESVGAGFVGTETHLPSVRREARRVLEPPLEVGFRQQTLEVRRNERCRNPV